jgi:transcriptional regulator with XRE-family HTH domain
LRKARESKGIAGRELARRTGVSQDGISELERGKRKAYRATILKLSAALECEPWTLVDSPWEMNDKEKKAFARLIESGRPQSFFPEEERDGSD